MNLASNLEKKVRIICILFLLLSFKFRVWQHPMSTTFCSDFSSVFTNVRRIAPLQLLAVGSMSTRLGSTQKVNLFPINSYPIGLFSPIFPAILSPFHCWYYCWPLLFNTTGHHFQWKPACAPTHTPVVKSNAVVRWSALVQSKYLCVSFFWRC